MTPSATVESIPGGSASAAITVVVPATGTLHVIVKSNATVSTGCTSSIQGALTLSQSINSGGAYFLDLYQINATAGTHILTCTNSTANIRYIAGFCVTGALLDVSASNVVAASGTTANGMTSGSVTTTAADLVMECFYGVTGALSPTVGTVPNAFTNLAVPSNPTALCIGYFQQGAAAAINPTGQTAITGAVLALSFAVKPLAVPTTYTYNTSGGGNGTGATASFNIAGVNSGDVILVWATGQLVAPTVADGQGSYTPRGIWNVCTAVNAGSQIFSLIATVAGTHAVTITYSASINYKYTYWVGTPSAAANFDGLGQIAFNAATNPYTVTFANSGSGDTVVTFANNWGGPTRTAGSGTNRTSGGAGSAFVVQDEVQSGTGNITPSVTYSVSNVGQMDSIGLLSGGAVITPNNSGFFLWKR